METYDLIIIGAGPAGLAASIYAWERKLKTLVLEADRSGGQPLYLYADKHVYDYPSYPEIKGKELATKIVDHAHTLDIKILEEYKVEDVQVKEKEFIVKSTKKDFLAKSVIIATGIGNCAPRKLGVPGEKEFTDKGIFYQELPAKLTSKRVVVVGGGDTALETAVMAAERGAVVTLIHRSHKFRALEKTVEKARSLSISLLTSSKVTEIHGSDRVENIEIVKQNGGTSFLSVDHVIICIGMELQPDLFSKIGIKTDKNAIVVDGDMQTSITGIFACGDVIVPAGYYKRISIAVGSAAKAVNGVYQYLKNPYWSNPSTSSG